MLQGRCWRLFSACAGRVAQSRGQPSQPSRRWCTSASHQENNHPVIIVGAGPSGLTLALWLSRYGEWCVFINQVTWLMVRNKPHFRAVHNACYDLFTQRSIRKDILFHNFLDRTHCGCGLVSGHCGLLSGHVKHLTPDACQPCNVVPTWACCMMSGLWLWM